MTSLEALAAEVREAHMNVEKAKILYYNNVGTYDNMAAAAKTLCNLTYEYQKAKYPRMKPKRIPYQAILR